MEGTPYHEARYRLGKGSLLKLFYHKQRWVLVIEEEWITIHFTRTWAKLGSILMISQRDKKVHTRKQEMGRRVIVGGAGYVGGKMLFTFNKEPVPKILWLSAPQRVV